MAFDHLKAREMEYIEQASNNTFYPFQNTHQIHWHLQIVKILYPLTKSSSKVERMGEPNFWLYAQCG